MSMHDNSGEYELWALDLNRNWVCYASISIADTTHTDPVQYAAAKIAARPVVFSVEPSEPGQLVENRISQLMRVLPAGRRRVALWVNGVQVSNNTFPHEHVSPDSMPVSPAPTSPSDSANTNWQVVFRQGQSRD